MSRPKTDPEVLAARAKSRRLAKKKIKAQKGKITTSRRRKKRSILNQKVALRQDEALSLRLKGARYSQIAELLVAAEKAPKGYTRGNAHRDVQNALQEHFVEHQGEADLLRQLELDRLDSSLVECAQLMDALRPLAMPDPAQDGSVEPPDLFAVDRFLATMAMQLRIGERRARLLGIDTLTLEIKATLERCSRESGIPVHEIEEEAQRLMAALGTPPTVDVKAIAKVN